MRHHLEDSAGGIAGAVHRVHLGLHALLGFLIGAVQQDFILGRQGANLGEGNRPRQARAAHLNHMAEHLDLERRQQLLGHRSGGHARRGLTGAGPLQNVARLRKVVLKRSRQVGMARTRRLHRLVFCRVALAHRQRLVPVLPVAIFNQHGNGRADGVALAHAAQNACVVVLDLHASAAAKALLAAPEFVIDIGLGDRDSGRET